VRTTLARFLIALALVQSLGCGSDEETMQVSEMWVGVHTTRPEGDQARVIFSSIYLDPFGLAEGPVRVAVNGNFLLRRNAVTGKDVWVSPGPLTACFDLPAGQHVFSLHDSSGFKLAESLPIALAGGTATQVVFRGSPQRIANLDLPTVVLADVPDHQELVRVFNLTAAPAHVMRCAGSDCVDAGVVLQMFEHHQELLDLGSSLRLELRPEDGDPFVPVTARAEHGGHLVAGMALLTATPSRECNYLCDTGIVRTSFVAESALDPRR
jgi:hypothetical protein